MSEVYEIRLTNTDEVTLIDAEDFERAGHINWYKDTNGYVCKNKYIGNGKWKGLKLHRMIIEAKDGEIVDHINRNRLDNRKENLRIVSHLENAQNASLAKNNKSGYKGVHFRNGKYSAMIRINGHLKHIGTFETAEEAAKAYNVMAEEHFGEYAALNDVDHAGYIIPERRKAWSEYRGVTYHKHKKKWYAFIQLDGKTRHIGVYLTEEEAARAYNEYAYEVLGDEAILNIISEKEVD